jgi:ketosteroid isomerase-like protein
MSKENVEIVRQAFEAASRREPADPGTWASELEMDFSGSPFADFVTRGRARGLAEVRHTFRDFYEAFDDVEADVTELIDAGEHVIAVFTYRGIGRTSGVPVEFTNMAGLWTLRNGKVARVAWLKNRSDAIKAAGLRE